MLKLFYSTSSAGGFFTPRAHKKKEQPSSLLLLPYGRKQWIAFSADMMPLEDMSVKHC